MTTLSQILAVEKGAKSASDKAVNEVYHALQRTTTLDGLSRKYRPKDAEDTDIFPDEEVPVQTRVKAETLNLFQAAFARYLDVVFTKDAANQVAKADVKVDGVTIAKDVPVPTLLFLEKQLLEIKGIVDKLPVLDPARQWVWNPDAGLWQTPVVTSVKTKKINTPVVLYQATDKHPAQVQMGSEDVLQGYWDKIEFSGAVSADEKRSLQAKVLQVQDAVRVAREAANTQEVTDKKVGESLLKFIFG